MGSRPDLRIRGVMQSIPAGYVLGRTSPGVGPPHLIPISRIAGQTNQQVGSLGGAGAAGAQVTNYYFLGVQAKGPFASRDRFPLAVAPHQVKFPSTTAAAGRSIAVAGVAPTGAVDLILTDDYLAYWTSGTNIICTVHFNAASNTGTFTYVSTTVAAGTVLWLVMPTGVDATLDLLNILFCGDQL